MCKNHTITVCIFSEKANFENTQLSTRTPTKHVPHHPVYAYRYKTSESLYFILWKRLKYLKSTDSDGGKELTILFLCQFFLNFCL